MSWDEEPDTRPAPAILAGLGVMLVAVFFALAGTGAGHGWMRPASVTLFLFPIWPIAFWLPWRRAKPVGWIDAAAAMLVLAGAAFVLPLLLIDDFRTWTYSDYREVDPPWFLAAAILAVGFGAIAFALRRKWHRMLLPLLLLGIGLLVDLGLIWQAKYGPGPWGYRGHAADIFWFGTWAIWQAAALLAVWREWNRYEEASWELDA